MHAHSNGQDFAAEYALSQPGSDFSSRSDADRLARIIGSNRLARESATAKLAKSLEEGNAESQPLLQAFIAEELQNVKAAMASEVQASKNECLEQIMDMKMLMASGFATLQDGILRRPQARNTEDDGRGMSPTSIERNTEVERLEEHVIDITKEGGTSIGNVQSEKKLAEQKIVPMEEGHVDKLKLWNDLKPRSTSNHSKSIYRAAIEKHMDKSTLFHKILEPLGVHFPTEPPTNCLAKISQSSEFHSFQSLVIVLNTMMMGYESDLLMRNAIEGLSEEDSPSWLYTAEQIFNIIFAAELLCRMVALRYWFFVSPDEWRWNMFDILIVGSTFITDFIMKDLNLSFLRTLRMLRALRAVRAIRMLKVFRELREMFFAILACVASLVWFFLFLAMIMFMVSIFLLQGLIFAVYDMDLKNAEHQLSLEIVERDFGSLPAAMFSLLGAISGGNDWVAYIDALQHAGKMYVAAFVFYVLFVTIGVINVLTGVFLANAGSFADESLIIANQNAAVDETVKQFLALFKEFDPETTGKITWPMFEAAMEDFNMQAYFVFQELDPNNARLIFELLDSEHDGIVDIRDFVMGMMKLKGGAKAMDMRVIRRQLGMLPDVLSLQ